MSSPATEPLRPSDVWHAARQRPSLWLIPTVAFTLFAVFYATFRTRLWEASQALVVRDETSGSMLRPGKFTHADDMKTVQETILELAKSHDVLRRALASAGPADGIANAAWPSDGDVEDLYDSLRIIPPKGAEFGKTEVFYVSVRSSNRVRAITLAAVISRELQDRYEELRESKAVGVVHELAKTVQLAQDDLQESTNFLAAIESQAGIDSGDLRLITESASGESGLRKMLVDIEAELRTQRANQSTSQELVELLSQAQSDPTQLLVSPSKLLDSQPTLKRLKDGLVDAQLRSAQLLGSMNEVHPLVIAARAGEDAVAKHLYQELANASQGVAAEIKMTADRIAQLESQRAGVESRMQKLTSMRANYANLASAVKHRTEILKTAQTELSEARANHAAARTSSLITLVGGPETGNRPAGPSAASIVFFGAAGGCGLGVALLALMLTSPRPTRATASVKYPAHSQADHSQDLAETVWRMPTEQSLKAVLRKLASGVGERS